MLFFRSRPAMAAGWIVKGIRNEDVVTLITTKGTILEMVMYTEYDWEPSTYSYLASYSLEQVH